MKTKKKLREAMKWMAEVEAVIGNISLRLKAIEDKLAPGTGGNMANWSTTVEKFKEVESRIQAQERKIEWLNQHQNQGDQDAARLREKVDERRSKTEALAKRVAKLEAEKGKPLVEVLAKPNPLDRGFRQRGEEKKA